MATYAMTIDERSAQGKALVTYLGTLNIKLQPLTGGLAPCRFSKAEMKSILAESTAEARKGMGTSHEDFFFENDICSIQAIWDCSMNPRKRRSIVKPLRRERLK